MALRFFAGNLEQLDVALGHIALGDPNNARFGLMLTDNVVEITLHQIAQDESARVRMWAHIEKTYLHASALRDALGRNFDRKVKFARLLGIVDQATADSIAVFHSYRNEVYHIGERHEDILPQLSKFYFDTACRFLQSYAPQGFGWSSNDQLPERTKRFFKGLPPFPATLEECRAACLTLTGENGFDAPEFVSTLADHMDFVVDEQNTSLDVISADAPNPTTRDQAVIDCQTWLLAFGDEGKRFAEAAGFTPKNQFELVPWLAANYPLRFPRDPIQGWQRRAEQLRREIDPHLALKKYNDFMVQTEEIRFEIDEAHRQVEAYIDQQIDAARGN